VPSYRENVAICRKGAERCRWNAKNAPCAFEEEVWLDFAHDWTELAEAFEAEDRKMLN
jgi:hypothetical protein